jgi:hypothetical protein
VVIQRRHHLILQAIIDDHLSADHAGDPAACHITLMFRP